MINPTKRAAIIGSLALLLAIAAYLVPAVRDSHMGDFLRGGSIGASSVAVLMLVVAYMQHRKAAEYER